MYALRVALATAVLVVGAGISDGSAAMLQAQYRVPEAAATPLPAAERERTAGTDRDPKVKEKTPPPRPIVPPAGQQQNPALRQECAWIGQRIISLLFRDDPMTGSDFVPFYARFGCPEEHLGSAFACVVSGGSLENEALADRIALCWTDPTQRPTAVGSGTNGSTKGGDAKPAGDAKGGDAKEGGDAKGGDAKGGDAKGGDAKGGDAKGGDAKGGDAPAVTKPADGGQK